MPRDDIPAITDDWLAGARRRWSPHADERPDPGDLSLLVIHNISLPAGEFGGGCVEELFLDCLDATMHPSFASLRGLRVSAHLFIDRRGGITQFVPFRRRAWHAGVSCFDGRERCNDFSIGIELEGTDHTPYTDAQYAVLARVTVALRRAYPAIAESRIVGHAEIAPGRKTDPGAAFDWQRYRDAYRRIELEERMPPRAEGEC